MQEVKEVKDEGELLRVGVNLTCSKVDHYFVYQSGTEVRCTKCPSGYPIAPGTECRNGHLYVHGELVI